MILYEDDAWLAVHKPPGLATHAPRPGELGVVEWLELHLDRVAHPVSRLDRGTGGVLLLAKDAAASARAQRIHEDGGARKTYEFLSDRARPEPWTADEPLDGKPARTEFTPLGPCGRHHRYRARLARGRTHQIRRHAAAAGVPLLGDDEHGGAPWPRLALHCREVVWPEIAVPLAAPSPAWFDHPDPRSPELPLERRGAWPAAVADCWRAVHRDEIPDLPAAVDVYGPWADAVWFDEDADPAAARAALAPVLDLLAARLGVRGGTLRTHRRNPHRRALVAEMAVFGEPPPSRFTVTEHGLRYEISLTETQHTGLFLDQRDTRRRVARLAGGRRVANLFAYTCSFSVAAAAAGAEVVFSVDLAKAALETGARNFAANGLEEGGRGKFVRQDVRRWLDRQRRRKRERPDEHLPLDLLICDPPVFASSREGGRFRLEKEWRELAAGAADLLGPDGVAVFANNHRGGDHARYRRELEAVFSEVIELMPPLDHPRSSADVHHVRTFLCGA